MSVDAVLAIRDGRPTRGYAINPAVRSRSPKRGSKINWLDRARAEFQKKPETPVLAIQIASLRDEFPALTDEAAEVLVVACAGQSIGGLAAYRSSLDQGL